MSSQQKPPNHNEESADQRRPWYKTFAFYTTTGYAGGYLFGCGKGIIEGGIQAAKAGDTMKLGVKRIISCSAHRRFSDTAAFIGMLYASMEGGIVAIRGTDDEISSALAGFGTGALYRAGLELARPRLRSAAVAGVIGGIAAVTANLWKQDIKIRTKFSNI